MTTMSTPISQLPATAAPSSAPPVSDPEVLNVLQEMEAEVAKATQAMPALTQPMHHAPMHHMPMHMPTPTMMPIPMHKEPNKGWVDMSLLQKAGIVAVVATILFYPATLRMVYARLPAFEHLLESYDFIIRFLVLVVVLYFLLMKLKN